MPCLQPMPPRTGLGTDSIRFYNDAAPTALLPPLCIMSPQFRVTPLGPDANGPQRYSPFPSGPARWSVLPALHGRGCAGTLSGS